MLTIYVIDFICGDKCYYGTSTNCTCGGNSFGWQDNLYCCIPRNETCKGQGMLCKLSNID